MGQPRDNRLYGVRIMGGDRMVPWAVDFEFGGRSSNGRIQEVMFCMQCGREIADSSNFCSSCGGALRQRTSRKQLTLSATNKKLAGVCGGLAEYLDVDATIVRLIWVALSVVPGGFVGGALAYFLAWIIIPKAPGFVSEASVASAQPSPKAT